VCLEAEKAACRCKTKTETATKTDRNGEKFVAEANHGQNQGFFRSL
jgi:hypothetical protein